MDRFTVTEFRHTDEIVIDVDTTHINRLILRIDGEQHTYTIDEVRQVLRWLVDQAKVDSGT